MFWFKSLESGRVVRALHAMVRWLGSSKFVLKTGV